MHCNAVLSLHNGKPVLPVSSPGALLLWKKPMRVSDDCDQYPVAKNMFVWTRCECNGGPIPTSARGTSHSVARAAANAVELPGVPPPWRVLLGLEMDLLQRGFEWHS
jgi:hypothetical protein